MTDNQTNIKHIAFIMDGNGRWAKARGKKRTEGHREGARAAERVVKHCLEKGIECVSLYAFSTENWSRPKDEVDELFGIVRRFVKNIRKNIDRHDIRITFMGDTSVFPPDLAAVVEEVKAASADKTGGTLNVGLNYGARDEILRAANLAVQGGVQLDKEGFGRLLYTAGLPELDVLVRTSGEHRLSNFMLYQAAYAEMFFINTLWPDLKPAELDKIFQEYKKRDRRYGGI